MIKAVIVYDIDNNERRKQVYKILQRVGVSVQKSVFEITDTLANIQMVREQLNNIVDTSTDSIIIYNLGDISNNSIIRIPEEKINTYYDKGYIIL